MLGIAWLLRCISVLWGHLDPYWSDFRPQALWLVRHILEVCCGYDGIGLTQVCIPNLGNFACFQSWVPSFDPLLALKFHVPENGNLRHLEASSISGLHPWPLHKILKISPSQSRYYNHVITVVISLCGLSINFTDLSIYSTCSPEFAAALTVSLSWFSILSC